MGQLLKNTSQNLLQTFDFGFAGNVSAGEQVELWPPENPMGENSYHQSPLAPPPLNNSNCFAMD